MTQVAFHFGAVDKLSYVCRLLRKATASGSRVIVVADAPTAIELDAQLWAVGPADFVSHCTAEAPQSTQDRSVVLLAQAPLAGAGRDVLVNLAPSVPDGFEAFERLIEVIGLDEEDRSAGRRRWKQYTERGYSITKHDLVARGATA